MRKKLDIEPEDLKEKWGVLQENERDIEASGFKHERSFVKEGRCEECGALDMLSKFRDSFMCGGCIKLSEARNRKHAKAKLSRSR